MDRIYFPSKTYAVVSTFAPVVIVFTLLNFVLFDGSQSLSAAETFSKDEAPFGTSYDDWVSKYWNWWIGTSTDEATPRQEGCLVNKNESMVMLIDTADFGTVDQTCTISSTQGIMVPLWIGWCDSAPSTTTTIPTNEPLAKCAREQTNLGNIRSDVSVDGVPVAKLDVKMSIISGELDYQVNSLANVTEFYTKDFDLTIPPDTHKPNQTPGEWRAGSHGWAVFLKPLPPGEHTVSYNVRVTPTGALTSPGTNPHFADITYRLLVE
jgi:hypothetical protein